MTSTPSTPNIDLSLGAGSWELPDDLGMVRDTVRRFMQNEVKPIEDTVEHDAYELPREQLDALQKKAKSFGLSSSKAASACVGRPWLRLSKAA